MEQEAEPQPPRLVLLGLPSFLGGGTCLSSASKSQSQLMKACVGERRAFSKSFKDLLQWWGVDADATMALDVLAASGTAGRFEASMIVPPP